MTYAPPKPSDEQLFAIARDWIDLAARNQYEAAFERFSYLMAPHRPEMSGADAMRADIALYRSSDLFPGETNFQVSDWRTATGGNPEPLRKAVWYKPDSLGIACVVSIHLPLNGKWSDLLAEFLLYDLDTARGHRVVLEDLSGGDQPEIDEA